MTPLAVTSGGTAVATILAMAVLFVVIVAANARRKKRR
jgi:hypothetical protein